MRRNFYLFSLLTIFITLLWLLAGWSSLGGSNFFERRDGFIQLSGVLGLWFLTVSVILAARPKFLEPYLMGLDKMYRIHKWVGISGLLASVIHWFYASGFKFLIQWGWIVLPAGFHRPSRPDPASMSFIQKLGGPARGLSEWAFFLMIILVLIALITLISYKIFAISHRLTNIVYLLIVFHSAVLFEREYWLSPIGIISGIMMAAGTVYALLLLFRIPNRIHSAKGKVSSVVYYEELNSIEIEADFVTKWKGHQAGQFAFLKTRHWEDHHPFTIASNWRDDGKISFVIKELGDYTGKLIKTVKTGDGINIEGAYGRFNFEDEKELQIWIGAGIGITPFIARLKELKDNKGNKRIVLYTPVSQTNEEAFNKLKSDAETAGVDLHIWHSKQMGRLSSSQIKQDIEEWKDASIWFCGPSSFMKSLRREFLKAGLNQKDFHVELFEMR